MFKGTTIVAVKHNKELAIGGDGQVTFGDKTIMKQKAKKVRKLYNGTILAGFAGSVADAFTLFEKFENKVVQYNGNIQRAAVELAKEWRSDKILHKLEALLIVGNQDHLIIISGSGEIIEPDDNIAAIGSGGSYALAAAKALTKHTELSPKDVVQEALNIAASICVFTNHNITVEVL
ncbi:MAG: ATP-dependent protease subunit HslV [Bacillota bacterium]